MYSCRRKKCCCQGNINPNMIETLCNNVGTTPEFSTATETMNNNCGCGCCCEKMETHQHWNKNECACGFDEEESLFPENPMLAQSYVPIQYMDRTFTPACGLKMGTIFPELVSPYVPCQSMEEIAFIKAKNKIGEGCNQR